MLKSCTVRYEDTRTLQDTTGKSGEQDDDEDRVDTRGMRWQCDQEEEPGGGWEQSRQFKRKLHMKTCDRH